MCFMCFCAPLSLCIKVDLCMQGTERSQVPAEVVEAVREEFRRHRVTDKRQMTKAAVRRHLKRIRMSRWYDHCAQIARELSGIQEVVIPDDVQQKLRVLFKQTEPAFEAVCPDTRSNYINYSFAVRKLLQLLGLDHLMKHFATLKNADKRMEQLQIWKAMCHWLSWQYIEDM